MEDKTMLLLFGALVVIMLCILFFRKRKVVKKHEEKDYDAALAIVHDFEEVFFARCQQGEEEQHFLNLASQQDAAIIQSLLYSADIPSRIDSDIMHKIYGGTASATAS